MSGLMDLLRAGNEALKKIHNLEQDWDTIRKQVAEAKQESATFRTELLRLEGRVSALEEHRNTIVAKMEAIAATATADVKVALSTAVADLRVDVVQYKSDLAQRTRDPHFQLALPPSEDGSIHPDSRR
jgi:phage shock protein A